METLTLTQKEQARLQVLNSLLAEQMTVDQAATLMGVSTRHTRRILAAYREEGAAALAHGHRGRRAPNTTPEALRSEVLRLARTRYSDANHTHLGELLREREGIEIGRTTLRRILTGAGLKSPRRRRPPRHRVRRQRMPREGMLIQVDAARFPATKSLDTFDFPAMPSVNKHLVMQLARCEYVDRRENVIAIGNSGTGKTHVALGLGLAACQRGLSVGFTTAASLVHELIEARDERRLLNLQKKLARLKLLIVDELGFVPLSKTGAELLFEVFSHRYERGSVLVTTNLPFDEWTEVFGSERLTGALLGPPHSPRSHPGDERRELPLQAEPTGRHHALSRRFP